MVQMGELDLLLASLGIFSSSQGIATICVRYGVVEVKPPDPCKHIYLTVAALQKASGGAWRSPCHQYAVLEKSNTLQNADVSHLTHLSNPYST